MDVLLEEFSSLNSKKLGIMLYAQTAGKENDFLVIAFHGSLNTDNSIQLSESLFKIFNIELRFKKIVFDLKKLDYVSSAGIGTLVTFLQKTKSAKIDLILCNVNSKVLTVIETLGFASFFTIIDDCQEVI